MRLVLRILFFLCASLFAQAQPESDFFEVQPNNLFHPGKAIIHLKLISSQSVSLFLQNRESKLLTPSSGSDTQVKELLFTLDSSDLAEGAYTLTAIYSNNATSEIEQVQASLFVVKEMQNDLPAKLQILKRQLKDAEANLSAEPATTLSAILLYNARLLTDEAASLLKIREYSSLLLASEKITKADSFLNAIATSTLPPVFGTVILKDGSSFEYLYPLLQNNDRKSRVGLPIVYALIDQSLSTLETVSDGYIVIRPVAKKSESIFLPDSLCSMLEKNLNVDKSCVYLFSDSSSLSALKTYNLAPSTYSAAAVYETDKLELELLSNQLHLLPKEIEKNILWQIPDAGRNADIEKSQKSIDTSGIKLEALPAKEFSLRASWTGALKYFKGKELPKVPQKFTLLTSRSNPVKKLYYLSSVHSSAPSESVKVDVFSSTDQIKIDSAQADGFTLDLSYPIFQSANKIEVVFNGKIIFYSAIGKASVLKVLDGGARTRLE